MSSSDSSSQPPLDDDITYQNPSREPSPDSDRAVSLEYDEEGDDAPRVTAKGQGELARKIIELARQEDIPLYQDEDLVELLYSLDIQQEIPPDLYEVVAEIFAFLYRVNDDQKENRAD